jgi:hypothetical protein
MFKKNLWVAGLIAVLAIMFVGCVDEYVPPKPEGEIVTVLDMQDVLAGVAAGPLDNAKFNEIFNGTPFKPAGGIPGDVAIEIIDVAGGKKGIKVKPAASWGAGIDIRDIATADGNTGVDYQIEDEIYIKGKGGSGFQLTHGGGAYAFFDWHPSGDFEETFVMTTKEVTDAKLAVPPNRPATIRINNDSSDRTAEFTIYEFVLTGYRKSGFTPEPPPPPTDYAIPSDATYSPPSTPKLDYNEFWVDFNGAEYSVLNGDDSANFPTAKILANKLTVTFNRNPQTIFIPFSDGLANLVKAAADAGYSIDVTIDGTTGTLGGYRWAITNGEGSAWATSNLISGALSGTLNNLKNQNTNPKGFLFQCNNATFGTAELNSIKFKFVASAVTPPGAITTAQSNITITFPLAGWAPSSVIASDGVTGSVKFIPNPIFGRFERSTIYYAEITITPKAGIFIPLDAEFLIKDEFGAPDVSQISYDPLAGKIITKVFPITDATDSLSPLEGLYDDQHGAFAQESGSTIVFELSDYISDNFADGVDGSVIVTAGDFADNPPLCNAGEPTFEFLNNGLNISGRTEQWHAIDLNFTGDDSLDLDFTTKSYKVTVWGNLNGAPPAGGAKVTIQIPYSDDPWQANLIQTAALTAGYAKFELNTTITPTIWETSQDADPSGDVNRIRIRVETATLSFRICRITVEELP